MFPRRDKGLNVNRYLLLIRSASIITFIILYYIVNNILIHRPVAGLDKFGIKESILQRMVEKNGL